jgi:hypothetical protein
MKSLPEDFERELQLLDRYNRLLREFNRLKDENRQLKEQLGLSDTDDSQNSIQVSKTGKINHEAETADIIPNSIISSTSDSADKIRLFITLFICRRDVYAKRWENTRKGTSGYSPVCLNEWQAGICAKPKISCSRCTHKSYAFLDENIIENHLRGNIVVGIYPMFSDETCSFLAIDFDEGNWQKDITVLREVCTELAIPFAVERSRSGNGMSGFSSKIEYPPLWCEN